MAAKTRIDGSRQNRKNAVRHGAGPSRLEGQRPGRQRLAEIWERSAPCPAGTQMIRRYGSAPTPIGDIRAYDESTRKLVESGIPPRADRASATPIPDAETGATSIGYAAAQVRIQLAARKKRWDRHQRAKALVSLLHHLDAPWENPRGRAERGDASSAMGRGE